MVCLVLSKIREKHGGDVSVSSRIESLAQATDCIAIDPSLDWSINRVGTR